MSADTAQGDLLIELATAEASKRERRDRMALVDMNRDSERIKAAILTDGREHLGSINPNRVRKALTNDGGNLDVWPNAVGPAYSALRAAGLIAKDGWVESDDRAGGNAGKPARTYQLTGSGWSA